MLSNRIFLVALLFLVGFGYVYTREPYSADVTVGKVTADEHATTILGLTRELQASKLQALIPFYTPNSAASIALNLRGIKATASFATNSTTLIFTVPQLGITESFSGTTRNESVTLFKDFIKDGIQQRHKGFLKAHARLTPIDPIAGNPNSLQAQMAQADFMMGRLSPFSGCTNCWESQPVTHFFQGSFNFSRVFSHRFDSAAYNFPHRYSYSPTGTWSFILDAPISLIYIGGAYAVAGSAAVGFRLPITPSWSLTPTLRFGSGGSIDLNTGGNFIAPGITSTFNFRFSNFVLTLMDSVGYYASTNFWLGGINFNYRLHNSIFKNGLFLTSCQGFRVCDREVNFSTWVIDSYFSGDELFIRHYDEIGLSLLTTHVLPCMEYDCLSIGAAYQFGNHNFHGYTLNVDYQF